mgnify:CR=1 FL=1
MVNDYLIKTSFRLQTVVITFSVLTATIGSFVDGCVIGIYLGSDSMAAFGYALPVVMIIVSALGGALSDGSAASCAVHIGANNTKSINANFSASCLLSVVTGAFITVLFVVFSTQIAAMVGVKGNLAVQTAAYIRGIGIGVFPMLFIQVLLIYLRLDNDIRLNIFSVVIMTAINISLDIIFVSRFQMGLFGIGLATSISAAAAMCICLIHFLKPQNTLRLIKNKAIPQELKNILYTGAPTFLNGICLSVRGLVLNNLLFAIGGVVAVAALSVQNNVYQFLVPIIMGVGTTLSIMSGIFMGERDAGAMERIFKISMRYGIIICCVMGAALFVFAPSIVQFILPDGGAAQAVSVRALQFFSFSLPLSIIVINLLFYYQTLKKFSVANTICFVHGLLGPVAAAFFLSGLLGTDGVWLAFSIGEAFALIAVILLIRMQKHQWSVATKDFLMLPAGFTSDGTHVLDISIQNDMAQVMELSTRVSEFCKQYSQDKRKITYLSLCIEEIAGNIVLHGYKHPGVRFIDIRIILKENEFIFRVRDNGVSFNPLKYEDMDGVLGIRIVKGISKSIEYYNVIGFNNLIVTL